MAIRACDKATCWPQSLALLPVNTSEEAVCLVPLGMTDQCVILCDKAVLYPSFFLHATHLGTVWCMAPNYLQQDWISG